MTGNKLQIKPDNDSRESTIFLFGPHVATFTKQSMETLIRPISQGPFRDWILDTISGLPTYLNGLNSIRPEVARAVPGSSQLADLDSWLRHGATDITSESTLPSIIVGPLVVLIQLTQYWRYLELLHQGQPPADLQASVVAASKSDSKFETLGFCFGLLGALSVASASNRQDFQKYGATAVRLAMLIGALVDAREVWDKTSGKGGSLSFAIAWLDSKQASEVRRIIDARSLDAYIAVLYDEARATVTTSEPTAPLLVKQLRAAGAIVAEIGIKGRIHSPDADRKIDTDALVQFCSSMPDLQYAATANLALPTYENRGNGDLVSSKHQESMTEMVLRSILVDQCNWYGTFSAVATKAKKPFVVTFGMERCVPPTLIRDLDTRQVHFADLALEKETGVDVDISQLPAGVLNTQPAPAEAAAGSEHDLPSNLAVKFSRYRTMSEYIKSTLATMPQKVRSL